MIAKGASKKTLFLFVFPEKVGMRCLFPHLSLSPILNMAVDSLHRSIQQHLTILLVTSTLIDPLCAHKLAQQQTVGN